MASLFSQPIPAEDYAVEKGECPLDRGRADYLKFRDQDLDLGLLGRAYPLGTRVCPRCLLASSESDFLTGVRLPGSDTITGTLNSKLNSLAGDFAAWLPARLWLTMAFLESLSVAEFHALVDRRQPLLERNLLSFLAVSFPSLPATALVKHLIQMMRAKLDPIELIGKLMGRYQAPAEPPDHDPLGRLVAAGASPGMALQTLLYGPLVAGFDTDTLALFGPESGFPNALLAKLALFQLELERLTILMTYVNGKPRFKTEIKNKDCLPDPRRFVAAVESHIQSEHTTDQAGRAQRGYHYLNMGRNHYKAARLCLDLLQAEPAADPDHMVRTLDHLDRAWGYLELSLVAEKYPEFEAQERPQSLCQKGRAKVPFFFGEFGVRLMLCRLYNDLGRLAATGIRTSKPVEALAQELCSHWVKIHGKFREVEFGGFDDPKAAKLLIPRMMALPAICFHPKAADALRKLIAANQERLYGRYQADAAAFAPRLHV